MPKDNNPFVNLQKPLIQRQGAIANASNQPLPQTYPMNQLAQALHPASQHLIIKRIINHPNAGARSFVLGPDPKRGTAKLAYFQAGQYISVRMKIGQSYITRPYAISSSPKDALNGKYMITIKKVPNGFATNYIWDNWHVGTSVTVSAPQGQLFYEPVRDAKTIIGIAGGSGITPFYAMAQAIADGTNDNNLIILYGSRSHDTILLGDELAKLTKQSSKIKVVNVLSDDPMATGFEHGFINRALVQKFAPANGDYSVFISGPSVMYQFVTKELASLHLPAGAIRHELNGNNRRPADFSGYPAQAAGKLFHLVVKTREQELTIPALADESILVALERAGIIAPSSCRSGACGACRSRVLQGTTFTPAELDGRRAADKKYGYVYTCIAYPTSDLSIEVPVRDFALEM
jgi:ferredoxin-NADP reductase